MTEPSLARRIFSAAHLTGHFTLRSGETSDHYFDKYQFEADPVLLKDIVDAMIPLLPPADVLAGIEMGGIPIATVLSQVTRQPTLFVRKEAKTYGTARLAEGGDFYGRQVLLVEDVVSSGGQIRASAEALRGMGARIDHAICVIDRETGGTENLAQSNIQLLALFRERELTAD